jgi:uncharacterized membrane protein YheB (UPF0754 family)
MNSWLFLIPFLSACIGWFFSRLALKLLFHPRLPKKILGFTIQGVFPKNQPSLANKIAATAGKELFSYDKIEQKITNPQNLQKIMPMIEQQLDEFLRVKLTTDMPVISMFIGDKTIASLKKVFIQELEILFPRIMKSYAANLRNEFDLEKILSEKIGAFPPEKLEKFLKQTMKKELRFVEIAGTLIGFLIGLCQVIITWILL